MALILGDDLGLHSKLGFSESFNASYPCRFCKCSKTICNTLTVQDDNTLRNPVNYFDDVNAQDVSTMGVVELCVFNNVHSYKVFQNYSVDIMHDMLEGVCNYDISGIIRKCIEEYQYFTLENLNQRIQFFDYGPINIRNRPPRISVNHLKSHNQ